MTDASRTFEFQQLILRSDDLLQLLKDEKDRNEVAQIRQTSQSILSSSDSDFAEAQNLLRDYERKLDAFMKKTEEAKSEAVSDEELDILQRELDELSEPENLLMEELRYVTVINGEMDELECKRVRVVERKKELEKQKQDEIMELRKISMYASVTNIIPNLADQSRIRGYIVDRDTKKVENFEIDAEKMTGYEACNRLWKMITP